MRLFDTLGFQWNRDSVPREIPRAPLERVVFRFHRMLPEYVWDAGVLEGNPFTFPEVKTLLEGVTVGGRKVSDQEQILNLAESSKLLMELVRNREFKLDKVTFSSLHALVARNEAPLATEPGAVRLNDVFASGVGSLEQNVSNPFDRATAFFLFGSLQQFFFDGNKRTSRFMMNGVLMTEGIDAVSIPAVRAAEFNSRMVDFYTSRDATEMMAFVLDCHPEVSQIRQLNPGLSAVKDLPDIQYFSLSDSMKPPSHEAHSTRRVDPDAAADLEAMPASEQPTRAFSLEETSREARDNWRRNYYDKRVNQLEPQTDSRQDAEKTQPERDAGPDFEPDRFHRPA